MNKEVTIIPDTQIKLPVNAKKINLSETIKMNYGCKNCEWRYTGNCPHGLKPGEALKKGICDQREEHLKQYYRGVLPTDTKSVEPHMTQFEADYNQGLAQEILHRDFTTMMLFEKQLEDPDINDEEKLKITSQLRSRRKSWEKLWEKLRKFQEQRIDRETPKVNVNVNKTITPADVATLLKTVDVEISDDN